jgi:hypothetical protein
MPFTIDTDNLENDEFSLTENGSGDLVMEHKSTGATLVYNSIEDQWEPSGGIKTPTLEADGVKRGTSNEYLDAAAFDGSDADTRLSNAISAAAEGDTIYLENVEYNNDITISKAISLIGCGPRLNGSEFSGAVTANAGVDFLNMGINADLTHNTGFATIHNCNFATGVQTIDGADTVITNCSDLDMTLTTNSSKCVVDGCASANTVTDNGSGNIVGDIV